MKKWLTLKVNMLPFLSVEVNNTYEQYFDLIDEIKRTRDKDRLKEFKQLQIDITRRIKELEIYYEENINETLIFLVENSKIKMKKMLMYNAELINKIENPNNNDFNLNVTHLRFEETQNRTKGFESPTKINFGTAFNTNQTNLKTHLQNANSNTNLFGSNNQNLNNTGILNKSNTSNVLIKENKAFNPNSENKNKKERLKSLDTNNKNLSNNKSAPLLAPKTPSIANKSSFNLENLAKSKHTPKEKYENRRSQSQLGKEILGKKIQKINLDHIKLGKNKDFSLLDYRNNYLDIDGNFMPLKHIAFKIKLSENEYRLLVKEKTKSNKL